MKKIKYILTILFLTTTVAGYAQKGKPKPSASASAPEEYTAAILLAENAIEQFNIGNTKEAQDLINKSIITYPTIKIYEYCNALAKSSDIVGANLIAEKAISKVKELGGEIYMDYMFHLWDDIDRPVSNQKALHIFLEEAYKMNKEFGEVTRIIKNLDAVITLNLPLTRGDAYSQDLLAWNNNRIFYDLYSGDYKHAIKLANQFPTYPFPKSRTPEGKYLKSLKVNQLMEIYEFLEDFPKLKEEANNLEEDSKMDWLFMAYALLGDQEMAMQYYEKAAQYRESQNQIRGLTKDENYYLALISIAKKDYRLAINQLDQSIKNRKKDIENRKRVVDKWKIDKAYGDAYAGLQEYEKAKNYYNISLLKNPSYKPAIKALENLGLQYQQEVVADKTAPIILITEPATNRGLEIVSAENDILVKGTAVDPSGLKSVTVNGTSVYAQLDGNFWGNVALKAGVNKIIVIATDGAGNTSEHTFDIEKRLAVATSDVVPVVVKEGKNYCLLIGAQNYEDLNIPSLENPIQDAVRLKLILKKDYDFEDGNIFNLFNPSANDVKRQLLELTTVIQPEDNLLIFYAGHGIWVEKEKKGYWLLVDAKRNDSTTWLQNKDVLNLIAKLPSRHTLLITDACFSGGVFKTRSLGKNAPAAIKTIDEKISRVAITSGNDTEVPDESVFMKYLVKALTENKEKYLTAQKMFINQIMEAVMTETKTEPRYGTLELAGHIGGDYIFAKK